MNWKLRNNDTSKQVYVDIRKPITIREFEFGKAPMGWYRIDILLRKIKYDGEFRSKFTKEELTMLDNWKLRDNDTNKLTVKQLIEVTKDRKLKCFKCNFITTFLTGENGMYEHLEKKEGVRFD